MPEVVIIADDLTGANATSVLLARQGYKSATFLDLESYSEDKHNDYNIISISTDSRGIKENRAYDRVANVVELFKDKEIQFFSKRVDSTLRGNIGSEIDAVLDNLNGNELAIVVSAFPSSGRVTIGGYLMVHSVPLEKTDVAKDPKTPVFTSYVPDIIKEQSKYEVGHISLSNVLQGVDKIRDSIIEEKNKGNRVIVIDATTDDDINRIARAAKDAKLPIVAVDPGPFTSEYSKLNIEKPMKEPGRKVMMAIGSVTNLTRNQLEELKLEYSPLLVNIDAEKLIYDNTSNEEINRVTEKLKREMKDYEIVGVITTNNENEVLNLKEHAIKLNVTEDDIAQKITMGISSIVKKIMDETNSIIGGLYTSGGDVTVAVCQDLNAVGIKVKDEVLPLAAYGRIIDGEYDNTPIITKGGLVGDSMAMIDCIEYLLTKISNELHESL
ncbi:four-carbon acid sugar kinase family protein [Sporosalibacterium faouarense]|uniref:four-carbon acid sugar kinase family protein n=1 Tax=Sporosalibacterium faouarense TaxID=516123 RepID=UPI00141C6C5B|nr:four-carbon acid sugar kinase family protein [Sporosalibacterium faouarense]MTI47344.1 four-carbon acid sugar kinase family protein [Bacillota bacterium]